MLFLGPEGENIYRFTGFVEPAAFVAKLDEAERRWELYRSGQAWDAATPPPESLTEAADRGTVPAPKHVASAGLAVLGDDLWIAHLYDDLYRLDPRTGAVRASHELPGLTRDLCTDGELIYAVDASWQNGGPIRVVDPRSGEVVREIVTEANRNRRYSEVQGVVYREGLLWVLDGGMLKAVDPDGGDVVATRATELTEASGMDLRGDELYVCSGTSIRVLDWNTGKEVRSITTTSRVRSVACTGDELFVTRQPIWGHDRTHTYRQLWPAPGGGAIHRIARP